MMLFGVPYKDVLEPRGDVGPDAASMVIADVDVASERVAEDRVWHLIHIGVIGVSAILMNLVINWHCHLLYAQPGAVFPLRHLPALSPVTDMTLRCAWGLSLIAGPELLLLGVLNLLRERSYGTLMVAGSCVVGVAGGAAVVYDVLFNPFTVAPGSW